jgi:two-component system chemotaxis family response regulator WspR
MNNAGIFNSQEPILPSVKVTVLLIDDQVIIAEALRRMVGEQEDIEFHYVSDAESALQTAIELQPTVILQDLVMPLVDGYEMVRRLRAHPATHDVPIVVLSVKEDPQRKAEAFAVGANDYLVKLPDKLELIARIRYHSSAYINRLQRDNAFRFLRESQQKLAEANIALQKLSALDGLTGIANRRQFDETLSTEWQRAQRSHSEMALLLCDIDFFKNFNDTYGHLAGDLCLKKVATVLTANLKRPADLAARYGGEEFALVLPDTTREGALALAEECRQQVELIKVADDGLKQIPVTMSIGVASLIPSSAMTTDDFIVMADRALYDAKNKGRNRVVYFA